MNIVVIVIVSFMAIATSIVSLYLMYEGFKQSTRATDKREAGEYGGQSSRELEHAGLVAC